MVSIRPQSHRYDVTIGILVILLGIGLLVPVNYLVVRLVPNRLDETLLSGIMAPGIPLSEFMPEQAERTQYLVSIILFPILCFGLFQLSKASAIRRTIADHIDQLYPASVIVASLILAAISYQGMVGTETPFFYFSYSYFYNDPMGGLLAFLVMLVILILVDKFASGGFRGRSASAAFDIAALLLILVTSCLPLVGEYDPIITQTTYHHYNAYLYSVVQVFLGKTLLVDLSNQYGFYPYFLEPIFKLIGLSSFKFTLIIAILMGLTLTSIYLVLRHAVRNRMIAFCGFAGVIFFERIFATLLIPLDPYLQYHPHRLLFPAIFILAAYSFFVSQPRFRRLKYHLVFVIASLAVFWNLDTGLVVFLTWFIVLIYQELFAAIQTGFAKFVRNCLGHLVAAACYAVFFTLALLLFTFIRSGHVPDPRSTLFYANIFYGMGFNMLPMKLFHPWNLVILCYAIGLVIAVGALRPATADPQRSEETPAGQTPLIFLLSVLGLGVFSYYQGRSHDYNLLAVWWPAGILLAIFLDMLYGRIVRPSNVKLSPAAYLKEKGLELAVFLVLFFFLSSSVASIASHSGFLLSTLKDKLKEPQTAQSLVVKRNVDFIKSHTVPGEQVYIFSFFYAAIYHMNSHTTSPIEVPGISELFLKSDFDKIVNYFKTAKEKKVFVDVIAAKQTDARILQEIEKYYSITQTSPDKAVFLLERKPAPGN